MSDTQCMVCKGSGTQACARCKGKGKSSFFGLFTRDCQFCAGSGKEQCAPCAGTGGVENSRRMMAVKRKAAPKIQTGVPLVAAAKAPPPPKPEATEAQASDPIPSNGAGSSVQDGDEDDEPPTLDLLHGLKEGQTLEPAEDEDDETIATN